MSLQVGSRVKLQLCVYCHEMLHEAPPWNLLHEAYMHPGIFTRNVHPVKNLCTDNACLCVCIYNNCVFVDV